MQAVPFWGRGWVTSGEWGVGAAIEWWSAERDHKSPLAWAGIFLVESNGDRIRLFVMPYVCSRTWHWARSKASHRTGISPDRNGLGIFSISPGVDPYQPSSSAEAICSQVTGPHPTQNYTFCWQGNRRLENGFACNHEIHLFSTRTSHLLKNRMRLKLNIDS